MIRSPVALEVMLHCYYSAEAHPRTHAPAVRDAQSFLASEGMIQANERGVFEATEKGRFYVQHLMTIPFPTTTFIIPAET